MKSKKLINLTEDTSSVVAFNVIDSESVTEGIGVGIETKYGEVRGSFYRGSVVRKKNAIVFGLISFT